MSTVVLMRFSVLDRAAGTRNEIPDETLRGVANHAQHVEKLGFSRFLLAEHHGVPGIPGSQPAQLATYVAANTSTIRVGTGGIMVPNHPQYLIAEQIGLLQSLFPDRIDIGLGSSVGFTKPVRQALRQGEPKELKARLEDDIEELLGYLAGTGAVSSYPADNARTPIYMLAGFRSALTAARLGIGVITGGPLSTQADAIKAYRENFQPSQVLDSPHVIASMNIAAADTTEAARNLLLPEAYSQVLSRSTGVFEQLRTASELDIDSLTSQQKKRIDESLANAIYGTAAEVGVLLADATAQLGVDEFLVTGDIPHREGRSRSEELLAGIM
ncbi:MAG: MsnO8 family LLM class oxidoreductase [Corynebacterium casei]|nr:MsnO8 family LLM class oxidoreductase [Corynebacterium casei]MDN5707714.1 MsnO8 family LLM class oxidoreductase [Corynebacterium casei]MDN5785048.1 MsnO8 family LLM class oxidoreductase [Corynebacterium casei]MDN5800841.1 MsnO8 family LLM class oxidoreductase [Corynebacterium casei]MDN5923262.1 MsnO8 family LLM class oxidoreductase [Corynebacterium casei]MDN6245958.1 MsnO8 family LLM class oxidoreductase [Corynebacterium casei]